MAQAVVAVLALLILTGMSVRANKRFSGNARLPMQWSLSGSVNWTAPRVLALSFTPVLAVVTLSAATIGTILSAPRPGQEGLAVPVILLLAIGLIAAHAFHLRLIRKTIGANEI